MGETTSGNYFKKIIENKFFYIFLIVLYVILFIVQINVYPLERYPGWDHFWVDARTNGELNVLKQAINNTELPYINPYINFGWDFAGDHHSFWGPLNLLVIILPSTLVTVIIQVLFLIFGGIGGYLFLNLLTKNNFISFFGALSYISIPFVIGLLYYNNTSYVFYLIPLFLFIIHRILEEKTTKKFLFFTLLSIFAVASCDIYVFFVLPAVIFFYSFLIGFKYYEFSFLNAIKKSLILLGIFLLSSLFRIIPMIYNLKLISSVLKLLREAGINVSF